METIKKGSKGQAVKALQSFLGIKTDGVFGDSTENAVKEFQKAHGLTPDGIVGNATWNVLGVAEDKQSSNNPKCVDPNVVYMPLSVHVSKKANRDIRYIAIHYTAGSSSAAGRARAIFNIFSKRDASADFAVDDKEMVQFNPDINNYYCWAVGDKKNIYSSGGSLHGKAMNSNTVSIEICSNLKKGASAHAANHEGWYFTDESLANARKLVRILMKKYNIPLERVVRHYDVSGKLCPGVPNWNNEIIYDPVTGTKTMQKGNSSEWLKFKDSLK